MKSTEDKQIELESMYKIALIVDMGNNLNAIPNKNYAISRYQVTFDEFDEYCEATGADKPSDRGWGRGNRPVINVSWYDTQKYIKWLNESSDTQSYRLPSEKEWEYACRSGSDTKWCFGDDESKLEDYAWYEENSDSKTHPVGELKPNDFGLYDMHGNVWEWCEDWYDSDKDRKVDRGGSWYYDAGFTASSYRYKFRPDDSDDDIGFRIARTLN